MTSNNLLWIAAFFLIISVHHVTPSRILGVFPHIGKSHFFVFEPFLQALASHGHDVHVISHFPQEHPIANYTDISVRGSVHDLAVGGFRFEMFANTPTLLDSLIQTYMLGTLGSNTCEAVLSFPSTKKLIDSNEKFDLVITELFNTDCFLGFVHKFQAPHIAMSSCALLPWASERFGNPEHPAYIPNIMGRYSDRMTFIERIENTLINIITKTVYNLIFSRSAQSIASRHFGESMPLIDDLARNTSLILVNTHPSLHRPRPLSMTVIQVGGIHVKPPKQLPKDLDQWLGDASDGVVFFSMGSMLRAESLPRDKLTALVEAFRLLPQRVLWKWEGDTLPGQPANVRIHKWLPQRDVLNHPNVRVFMTHCGLLGVTEAVQSGVPMVGMPIYGDQNTNCKALESTGVAVLLDFHLLTKQSVLTALRTVLDNSSYHENAKRLSSQYQDRPLSPMATALFWTEYVIRHKGAPHLRSASVDLCWYQYLLLDVALVLAGAALLAGYVVVLLARKLAGLSKKDVKQKQTKFH